MQPQPPDTINLELSFDNHGNLVVTHLPKSNNPNIATGKITLTSGNVETELRNILNIEQKIAKRFGKFYGEPSTSDLARDIKRSNKMSRTINTIETMELEF